MHNKIRYILKLFFQVLLIALLAACSSPKLNKRLPEKFSLMGNVNLEKHYNITEANQFDESYNFTNHFIPTTNGPNFSDLNAPEINIKFPFNIYYSRSKISKFWNGQAESIEHLIKIRDPFTEISIFKLRSESDDSYFNDFSVTDFNEAVYYEAHLNGFIFVCRDSSDNNQKIRLISSKTINDKTIIFVKMVTKTGNYETFENWKKVYGYLIEEYISYGISIYKQI